MVSSVLFSNPSTPSRRFLVEEDSTLAAFKEQAQIGATPLVYLSQPSHWTARWRRHCPSSWVVLQNERYFFRRFFFFFLFRPFFRDDEASRYALFSHSINGYYLLRSDWKAAVHHAQKHGYELTVRVEEAGGQPRVFGPWKFLLVVALLFVFNVVASRLWGSCAASIWTTLAALSFAFGKGGCRRQGSCRRGEQRGEQAAAQQQQRSSESKPAADSSVQQFRAQLQTLFDLGFSDVLQNVEQLKLAKGDLNVAVQGLLNHKE